MVEGRVLCIQMNAGDRIYVHKDVRGPRDMDMIPLGGYVYRHGYVEGGDIVEGWYVALNRVETSSATKQ